MTRVNDDVIRNITEEIIGTGLAEAAAYRNDYNEVGPQLMWIWRGKYYLGA